MLLTTAARSVLFQPTTRQTLLKAAAARGLTSLVATTNTTSASSHLKSPSPPPAHSLLNLQANKKAFKSTQAKEADTSGRDAYNVSQTIEGTDACKKIGLDAHGITGPSTIYRNLTYQELQEHELKNGDGELAKAKYGDTISIRTGKYTGRSPKDRFLVEYPGSETAANIDWNDINMPAKPEVFDELYEKAKAFMNEQDSVYVLDAYCGASPGSRRKVRFVTQYAWHQHFVTNMFIRPVDPADLDDFEPDFTIINCCSQVDDDWERHGLNSETAIVFNPDKETGLVFGSYYGGEMKKGIFGLMNYWLPMEGKLPMHCSANVSRENGDVALFFGLSGTGKTTLSADPHRALIGDDEHGWDDEGIFNFEGGCYAKTINLTEETEPDIYRAIRTDALFENVKLLDDKTPDYFDVSLTENGRVSYPIFHIDGYHEPQMAGHPNNIIFLSCDAFGVLPPVARLDANQAMYHFMSGYTAKVAGTERGIKEPVPNFSACFGAAFMTLHPTRYADLLKDKMEEHGCKVFLVNSGWSGGPYGVGERMSIKTTRTCVDAILDGSINSVEFKTDPVFGFEVPVSLPGVDSTLLEPRNTWANPAEYDAAEKKLASMYIENFKKYEGVGSEDYTKYGPQV